MQSIARHLSSRRSREIAILLLVSHGLAGDPALAAPAAEHRVESPAGGTPSIERPAPGSDPALTLAEVVRRAADRDPGRGAVEARRAEGRDLRSASRRWLSGAPTLYGSYVTDRVGQDDGYGQWDAGLEVPLWWPGQVSPRRRAADAATRAADAATEAYALEIAGRVRDALADLVLGVARLERTRAAREAEAVFAERIERAVALGEIAERELLLVRSAVVDCELEELAAREELEHAQAWWSLLTGLDRWPSDWQEPLAGTARLEANPLLRLARQDVARAEADATRLERARWGAPSLTIGSQHEREIRTEAWDHRLLAGLRIPIGREDPVASGAVGARRAAADARRHAARIERDLRAEWLHSEHRLGLARARLEKTRLQRDLAVDHLGRVERGFALGEVDLSELVKARARGRAAVWSAREAELLLHILIGRSNQVLGVVP